MNTSQWRNLGYLVHFCTMELLNQRPQLCGFLFHRRLGSCFATPINRGRWQDWDDLTQFPWVVLHQTPGFHQRRLYQQLRQIEQVCYCTPSGVCDYCTGLREPAVEVVNVQEYGCVRCLITARNQEWLIMNQRLKGWNSWAISYYTLAHLLLAQSIDLVEQRVDEYGVYQLDEQSPLL